VDLDLDGDLDLVVFDKAGDRILCYLNNGGTTYSFAPEYQNNFPRISGWLQLKDYNCDGKNDLFAYSPICGGIQVWKNVSDTVLKFEHVVTCLLSLMSSTYSNISLTYVDYPGIEDLDGDGDLDILVFFGLGSHIWMHRNNSMELYGNCDTLLYEKTYNCWGDIAESASSNHIFLEIICPWKCSFPDPEFEIPKGAKHTGSTMTLLDMNNDSLYELILGDVDYLNLTLLNNGGTQDSAHMISADTLFPSNTLSVNQISFPLASFIDVNNDNKRDLVVSPFDPNPAVPQSHNSVWLYENDGQDLAPVFNFQQFDYLQGDMIDVGTNAYPVMVDLDADGLEDLLVSNHGYLDSTYYEFGFLKSVFRSHIAYFRNTGSIGLPQYSLIDKDLSNLSQYKYLSLYPAFGDVDGDGDDDMVCGEYTGTLIFFENTAGSGNPAVFAPPQNNWQGIDVGDNSAPVLIDLDGDVLLDLVIGKKNGMLSYYRNIGSAVSPVFTMVTDSLGGVNVTDYTYSYTGFSTPHFFRDSLGFLKLLVGSEVGPIHYYKDIEANLTGTFVHTDSILLYTYQDSLSMPLFDGLRTAVTTCDLNEDSFPDLIAGNLRGGLNCYFGTTPGPFSSIEAHQNQMEDFPVLAYPNPAQGHLNVVLPLFKEGMSCTFTLFNLQGQSVIPAIPIRDTHTRIDISSLPAGVYFYRLTGSDLGRSGKVIVLGK
jgi:hypothetical protein